MLRGLGLLGDWVRSTRRLLDKFCK